ncbi:protein-disulfide reductase DsbD domain-containing protein [Tepidicaulis sp. LMO-SS28]|uniref:protein-disulfide reductase DsbD domain-containing protein n=1 Tax=Tepidicaulis sp. LMO-SS28 TaxID=3447455 RepID=UPI003EE01670
MNKTAGDSRFAKNPRRAFALAAGLGAAACAALFFIFMVNAPRAGSAPEAPPASAASAWEDAGPARVRLISAQTAHDGEVLLGIELELERKWKTYWRYPGDSGIPPRFDWSGSENLAETDVRWPAPEKFIVPDVTYGYKKKVVFPVRVKAAEKDEPLRIALIFDFGVCDDVCVPVRTGLALYLEAGTPVESAHADLIETWQARVPGALAARGSAAEAHLSGDDSIELLLTGGNGAPPLLIMDGPEDVYFGEAELVDLGGPYRYVIPVDAPRSLAGERVQTTFVANGKAWEETVTITP